MLHPIAEVFLHGGSKEVFFLDTDGVLEGGVVGNPDAFVPSLRAHPVFSFEGVNALDVEGDGGYAEVDHAISRVLRVVEGDA